jgi:hypothetical protein
VDSVCCFLNTRVQDVISLELYPETSNSGATAASFRFAVVNTGDKMIPSAVVERWSLYPLNQWYRVAAPHFACES